MWNQCEQEERFDSLDADTHGRGKPLDLLGADCCPVAWSELSTDEGQELVVDGWSHRSICKPAESIVRRSPKISMSTRVPTSALTVNARWSTSIFNMDPATRMGKRR